MKKQITILASAMLIAGGVFAQASKKGCISHQKHQEQLQNNAEYAARRASVADTPGLLRVQSETVYTIPVVIHIIHNGEAVGSGQNISDSQINSAISALNADFRKLNPDSLAASHPFYQFQADVGIEFCLAQRDPDGLATTGIMRYNKGQAAWTADDFDATVKPSTSWDPTKYLNIWVTSFAAPDDQTLGYATFPGTSGPSDGVVIGHEYFGTEGTVVLGFDKNRTATHEVGHYFNLYHIWGDATCGDDEVADTPTQEQDNAGCPSFPHNAGSACNPGVNGEMYMNYMDYVDDACMSMFTVGQKTRMRTALLGPRASLTTSDGCLMPTSTANVVNNANAKVFPNPAGAVVNISSSFEISTISILSSTGQVISVINVSGPSTSVNTSGLANGNYIIKITGANGSVNKLITVLN